MQTGDTKMRFGRCPHCRAMIYQNPSAAIYYCSKCRTPIRGKNPGPTDHALSSLEILSADTASVISDELNASCTQASVTHVDEGDQPPFLSSHNSCHSSNGDSQEIAASSSSPCRGFSSARRACASGSNGLPRGFDDDRVVWNEKGAVRSLSSRANGLRPSSRRTRRSSSSTDSSILRYDVPVAGSEERSHTPRNARHRRSPLSTSVAMSGPEGSTIAASPLTDPAFHRELLDALDNLRSMIDAIELQPPPASSARAMTRRVSRRLDSQLAHALPPDAEERVPRPRNASTGSSSSSNGHAREPPAMSRTHHCLPVLGGAPFVACGKCSELLQTPALMVPSRRGAIRLRCGGCKEVLEPTLPAHLTSSAGSAPRASGSGSCDGEGQLERAADRCSVAQQVPVLLHRALGYSSPQPAFAEPSVLTNRVLLKKK